MDIPAEITLRIARLGQEHRRERRMEGWFLVPEWRKTTWDETRDILVDLPKPVIVTPLVEPGYLTLWSIPQLPPAMRTRAEHHMANQVEFFTEQLQVCSLAEHDTIQLDATGSPLTFRVTDLMEWVRSYSIALGVSINRPRDSAIGYLAVFPPGGGGPPLGVPPEALRPD
jgi:hypothetical protein